MVDISYITPTALNAWNHCPAQWDYSRQPDIPSLPTDDDMMDFGSAVHIAIAEFYTRMATTSTPRPVEIDTRARQCFADNVKNFRHLKQRYEYCLNNFITFETNRLHTFKQYLPTFTEHMISSGFVRGKFDAYWAQDQTIVDWKTGVVDSMTDDFQRQGSLYRMMANESGLSCKRVLFVGLNSGKILEVPVVTSAWIEEQINSMRYGKVFPKVGPHCNYCGFQLRCEYSREGIGLWQI